MFQVNIFHDSHLTDSKLDEATDVSPTSPDHETKHSKTFSRFSLKKKKSVDYATANNSGQPSGDAVPSSPKQETKQRKHSLTSVFHKRKDQKATSPGDGGSSSGTSGPASPTGEEPVTSPTHNKERRGSALSRFFSTKKHEASATTIIEPPSRTQSTDNITLDKDSNDRSTPRKKTSLTTVESRNRVENGSTLSVPSLASKGLNESSESLYSENGVDSEEPSTRRMSRNKERIRNRKLAKREAAERHKSLPAGIGEFEIDMENGIAVPVTSASLENGLSPATTNTNSSSINGSPASVTDATPRTRKKHRARRSNTEFLGNVPLISVQAATPMMSKDDDVVNRRAAGRRNRRDRSKTLTNGIDSAEMFGGDGNNENNNNNNDEGVVNENMSFAEIKKKLLEGLTDDKKIPDKVYFRVIVIDV